MKRKGYFVLWVIAGTAKVIVLYAMGYGLGDWQWWGIVLANAFEAASWRAAHKEDDHEKHPD